MHTARHFFLSVLIIFTAYVSFAQCSSKSIVKENKNKLGEYKYESFGLHEIVYGAQKEIIETEFSCHVSMKYKIVFCVSNLHQNIGITIYDKPKTSKKRNVLYFDESGKDSYFANFSPSKTGTYYVEYEVPAATQPKDKGKGCVVMLIGIKEKVPTEK